MRNTGRAPHPGQDARTGRFIKGNRLGKGRPWGIPRVTLHLTYRDALQRACSPQDLLEITKRAVADAKKGDHFARMFLLKAIGADQITLVLNSRPAPIPVYRLDALTDTELETLGQLSCKMLEGPPE